MNENQFYILTGGPGAGKTAILHELQKKGFRCIEEVARKTIKEQMAINGQGVPWGDLATYKDLLLKNEVESYRSAAKNKSLITFFDRGIIDLIAYDRRTQTPSSKELLDAAMSYTYNKNVFVTPPWKDIFCNDTERKQTFEEGVEVYENLVKVYAEYGFNVIEVPKLTVEQRAYHIIKFIIDSM